MKYYLIAGEASGDLHAAALMKALKNEDKDAVFRFFGGDLMLAEGGTLVKHYREMAYMGFIPVILNFDKVLANIRLCCNDITQWKPDVVILVDYPGFNLKIAKFVKIHQISPVYYYISPKIWAWKEYRIKSIRKYVDRMFSILPFEVPFYQKHNYHIDYVGNPTVDELSERPYQNETFEQFVEESRLGNKPIIALWAGSRVAEIKDNLPIMIESASAFRDYQLVVAGAPGVEPDFYNQFIKGEGVAVVFGKTYRLLQQSRAALVTSGTATLETALIGVPQVVCYKMKGGKLAYQIFKRILHIRFVSLVNLIADREIVKELLVHLFTVENTRRELRVLLNDTPERRQMISGYKEMADKLGAPDAPQKAAYLIVESLSKISRS